MEKRTVTPKVSGSWDDEIKGFPAASLPIASKEAKLGKNANDAKALFRLFSLGVVTNRDDWVYAESVSALDRKIDYLISDYSAAVSDARSFAKMDSHESRFKSGTKWTRSLKSLARKRVIVSKPVYRRTLYRPFSKRLCQNGRVMVDDRVLM